MFRTGLHIASFLSRRGPLMLLAILAGGGNCALGTEAGDVPASPPPEAQGQQTAAYYTSAVVHAWPHDSAAFTQGLVFLHGEFLESTGLNGESTLREVELESGRVLRKISIPPEYFAEGLTVIGARVYQLTWHAHKGFIYDVASLHLEGEFSYDGEGWGLTTDGRWLILSDGTNRIRYLDPATFHVARTISVTLSGRPLMRLNELEWIRGEIFANVWETDEIVRIDPSSGDVRGIVDLYGLLPSSERSPDTDVLNGIAFDPAGQRLFVTGKRWPKIFEVRLIPRVPDP
jgi:glutamine cyclotransferase